MLRRHLVSSGQSPLTRQGRISHAFLITPNALLSTYRWLPMEPGSLSKLLTFLTPYRGIWHFGPIDYRSSVSLSALPTPTTIFLH